MNKVKLHLDDLQVESFAVQADLPELGTVQGLQSGVRTQCYTFCPTWCEPSCPSECYPSCPSRFYTECIEEHTCGPTCGTCDPAWCGEAG